MHYEDGTEVRIGDLLQVVKVPLPSQFKTIGVVVSTVAGAETCNANVLAVGYATGAGFIPVAPSGYPQSVTLKECKLLYGVPR